MPASTLPPTLALTDGSLGLADFFSTEFQCTASEAPNAEAQPAFTFRNLRVPRSIEELLDRGMVVSHVPSLCAVNMALSQPRFIHLFEFLKPPLLGFVH